MKTLQEINDELEKISKEYSKLFDREQRLNKEKKKLLIKEILDSKSFNRYKWMVKKRDGVGFILKPIFDDDLRFDDIQTKLDLYIVSYDIKAGIEFIKSQNIEIVISKDITDSITSMEKQVVELKEFVDQFNIVKNNSKPFIRII